jgi:glucan phosphoethanolaminetransferase (alkaline phosphatase superfamily)
VVLIIGESMRYDAYVAEQLRKLGFFYRKIYSGATGTDVAVPLLLNVKNDPLQLATDSETNLFRLAKKSGYQTRFVSIQTPKALQYIRPYLQPDHIDSYKSFEKAQREPYYDRLLLRTLQGIDFGHKQFIVMQQIGEHAPYRYFYGPKAEDIRTNYYRGVDESFRLYREVAKRLEERASKYVLIYVSDHGEFIGEGGRYGHNTFAPEIYEVPLFITANFPLPKGYEAIASHYDLSRYIMHLLGYGREITLPAHERTHIINGTMLSREDGFKVIHEQ